MDATIEYTEKKGGGVNVVIMLVMRVLMVMLMMVEGNQNVTVVCNRKQAVTLMLLFIYVPLLKSPC